MQRDDVDRATTFFANSTAYFSAAELADALGWTVQRAQYVLQPLERRRIVQRRGDSVDAHRLTYTYVAPELPPST